MKVQTSSRSTTVASLAVFTLLAVGFVDWSAAGLVIVEDGKPRAQIVVSETPTRMGKLAGEELRKYVRKISGAELPMVTKPTDEWPVKIYVGESEHTKKMGLENDDLDHGAYRMKSGEDYLLLLGRDDDYRYDKPGAGGPEFPVSRGDRKRAGAEWNKMVNEQWSSPFVSSFKGYNGKLGLWSVDEHGSLNAVNDFLRSLGVRWFMPGEFGEACPTMKTITVPDMDETVRPEFGYRHLGFYYNSPFMASPQEFMWQLRLGLNPKGSIGGHGISQMVVPEMVKAAHPEFYALYGDHRELRSRGGKPCGLSAGLRDSAVGYARFMFDKYGRKIISVMPTDGYSPCRCPLCAPKLTPARGRGGVGSDLVWNFVQEVAKETAKTHPDKKISCYAYAAYLDPPETIDRLNPNVAVGVCQHRCYFGDPATKDRYWAIRDEWLKKIPDGKIQIWEYYLHARPGRSSEGIPSFFPHLIAEDMKKLKGHATGEGIEVARRFSSRRSDEPDPALAVNHLNCYVTSRLWWDPDRDVDALLDDYCETFYGPAAKEMRAFIDYCEKHWPQMTQKSAVIDEALERLDAARKAAGEDNIHANRVQWVADYVETPLIQLHANLTTPRAKVSYTRLMPPRHGPEFTLDGKLDDAFWTTPPTTFCHGRLSECQTGREAYMGTSFNINWLRNKLYIGVRCDETKPATIKTPTDKNDDPALFEGDFVSVLLESQNHAFYEIAVAPNGTVVDIDWKDGKKSINWDSNVEVATSAGDGFWTAEMVIPVVSESDVEVDPDHNGVVGRTPNLNYPWFINVYRQRPRELETEVTALHPTGKTSARGRYYFGELRPRK